MEPTTVQSLHSGAIAGISVGVLIGSCCLLAFIILLAFCLYSKCHIVRQQTARRAKTLDIMSEFLLMSQEEASSILDGGESVTAHHS